MSESLLVPPLQLALPPPFPLPLPVPLPFAAPAAAAAALPPALPAPSSAPASRLDVAAFKIDLSVRCPQYTMFQDELTRHRRRIHLAAPSPDTDPGVCEQLYSSFKTFCSYYKKMHPTDDCSYPTLWPTYITNNVIEAHAKPAKRRVHSIDHRYTHQQQQAQQHHNKLQRTSYQQPLLPALHPPSMEDSWHYPSHSSLFPLYCTLCGNNCVGVTEPAISIGLQAGFDEIGRLHHDINQLRSATEIFEPPLSHVKLEDANDSAEEAVEAAEAAEDAEDAEAAEAERAGQAEAEAVAKVAAEVAEVERRAAAAAVVEAELAALRALCAASAAQCEWLELANSHHRRQIEQLTAEARDREAASKASLQQLVALQKQVEEAQQRSHQQKKDHAERCELAVLQGYVLRACDELTLGCPQYEQTLHHTLFVIRSA